ncbi:kinesin-like protein KIN-6 [Forsythia ovata]|uniref:Kinesin-like protein KIN-6 n=1 Tax=Forsythia ovata TaxID=205694 RepID=A0ABD1UCC5_9LAMI
MEMKSPPPCPRTATVRRNPFRKARATPSSAIPLREPLCSPSFPSDLPSFPLNDILSIQVPQNPNNQDANFEPQTRTISENLKVYLRIRPLDIQKNGANPKHARNVSEAEQKNAWPKTSKTKISSKEKLKRSSQVCVTVNEDLHSVTVSPPQAVGTKRIKSEVYEGFSHVFSSEASQSEVYEQMLRPLVEDFLNGKSGMLAAMGPSGSGKTHTVFGCAREPGMIPLALRHIFSLNDSNGTQSSRTFNLSMFEICSEKGKAEKLIDLSQHGGDICMQQSVLKGLQEAVVCDAQQAESLIALGMLKRATAMTNSNSQSSRSQCIINIRCVPKKVDGETDDQGNSSSVLTIVDFAGAEREKKTGNQGTRLLESNFINNTSMVFGLCLRSLLEHQKNPKRPLQKHFQNSLLTKYLRDYLEGKKRMTLILTVKPGEDDYLDTSFLLRQASPFTRIKFKKIEEPSNVNCNKRPIQALPRAEQLKKMKFGGIEPSLVNDGKKNNEDIEDCNLKGIAFQSKGFSGLETKTASLNGSCIKLADSDRKHQIMQDFSKALWNVLKQYKKKLEVAEKEIFHLRDSLTNEKTRCFDLDNELKELKSRCTCWKEASGEVSVVEMYDARAKLLPRQPNDHQEVNSGVSSHYLKELERSENAERADPIVRISSVILASCIGGIAKHRNQQEDLQESTDNPEDVKGFKDTGKGEKHSQNEATSKLTTACLSSDCRCEGAPEYTCIVEDANTLEDNARGDICSNGECISIVPYLSTPQECESANSHGDFKDPKDLKREQAQPENNTTDNSSFSLGGDQTAFGAALSELIVSSSESPQKDNSSFSVEEENFQNEEGKLDPRITNHQVRVSSGLFVTCTGESVEHLDQLIDQQQDLQESVDNAEDVKGFKDTGKEDMHSESEATCKLTTSCLSSDNGGEEATEKTSVVEDANTSDDNARGDICSNSECVSTAPCLSTPQECENADSYGDLKDPKDVKIEQAQPENSTTDNSSLSLDEDQMAFGAVLSESIVNYPESARKDNSSFSVEEEIFQNEDGKMNPPITILSEERRDGRNVPNFEPKLALCCNSLNAEKPKRKLLPASSVLLKDISILDVNDESEKPKGARREKTVATRDQNRTQGSISLIHMLRNNFNAK